MKYVALKMMQMPESCQTCSLNILDFCLVAPDDVYSYVIQVYKDGCRPDWCPLCIVDGVEVREDPT